MKNILFVHQSADLYGSDKVLFDLVTSLDKKKFHPILLLPSKGPLLNKLLNNNIETYVVKLTRLSRATLSVKGIITLPFDILKSLRMFNQILKNRRIDIVHSNTLATLTGAFWAKCNKVPHLWHVHEMISRPRIVLWGYLFLLYFFADYIVCNSHATRKLLTDNQSFLIPKSYVIWNGLKQSEKIDNEKVNKLRRSLHLGEKDLLIVLMGRINGWKGQPLFIDAANKLWKKGLRNIHFLMVGSPPIGQDHFKKKLEKIIEESPAKSKITLWDFSTDIWGIWHSCDIAVVPSTEPEPFGMVAIEAMAAGKAVIGASHGGLTEIIKNNITGILFEPGNSNDLAAAIFFLVKNPYKRIEFGENGQKRQQSIFALKKYIQSFENIYSIIR